MSIAEPPGGVGRRSASATAGASRIANLIRTARLTSALVGLSAILGAGSPTTAMGTPRVVGHSEGLSGAAAVEASGAAVDAGSGSRLAVAPVASTSRAAWYPSSRDRPVLGPPIHVALSYQIGGAFSPPSDVGIVDRDRSAKPLAGAYNVCYLNAFQAQPETLSWWRTRHRVLLLTRRGRAVVDGTWNEQLLDTSTAAKRRALARIVGDWIDGCARAGFRAVEPDNLDSWTRSHGALTRSSNLAYAALLITRAHARGLAVAQKNAAEVASLGRRMGFDFAVAEECQAYDECGAFVGAYGGEVLEIEYRDNGGSKNFGAACRARGNEVSIVYRDREVRPSGRPGYLERRCNASRR